MLGLIWAVSPERFAGWPAPPRGPLFGYARLRHLASPTPISVATDWSYSRTRIPLRIDVGVCDWLTISARGRLLVRNICMVFDRYLQDKDGKTRFSKVI